MDDMGSLDEVEEGELALSDVEYTPIPRPTLTGLGLPMKVESSDTSTSFRCTSNSGSSRPNQITYNSDSDVQDSSDSDDSDGPRRPKLPRMRPNLMPTSNTKPNKYNIWSQHLQESVLNEQLFNCDVDATAYDKSRNVESYNYVSLARFEDDQESELSVNPFSDCSRSNKRRYKDRGNVHQRLGHRRQSPTENVKGSVRQICDLKVTEADSPEDIANDIANKLYEEKESLILKTIQTLGAQKAINLFTKTKDIEGDGGMMILNGARRRTPGGVFLFLLRSDTNVTPEQKNLIFGEEHKMQNSKRKRDRSQKRKEKSKARMEQLKKEGLCSVSALPNLLTRAELVVKKLAEAPEQAAMSVVDDDEEEEEGEIDKRLDDSDDTEKGGEECNEEGVSNPPPSPATDNRENSSDEVPELGDRTVLSYAEDFLDIGVDDMDVF